MSDATQTTDAQIIAVGDSLRAARIAADWTVSEVANKLNLTENMVESIEGNQFERLPGTTFARGYIRSYAKILGLSADQLAKQFDRQIGSSSIEGAVHSIDRVGEARRISRGMLQFSAFVIFLIIIAAAYYAWQMLTVEKPVASNKSAVFERVEVERADGSVHVQTLDELEDQAVAFALEAGAAAAADVDVPADATLDDPQQVDGAEPLPATTEQAVNAPEDITEQSTLENTTLTETQAEQVPVLAPGMGAAQLSFANDCWLRVNDADGKEVTSGLKRAGEQLTVTGKAPLDVHLGYAKGVSIIYNGEPVDFSSAVRGETARFKLGQ